MNAGTAIGIVLGSLVYQTENATSPMGLLNQEDKPWCCAFFPAVRSPPSQA
jgi:hypothetical protein